MQVTINDIRYAVFDALDTAFPEIPVTGEEIQQNLEPPCFFVKLIEPSHTQELGRRYMRYHPFDIHYFAENRTNEDMYDMAERLTKELRYICVAGRSVRGMRMRHQILDQVLHFFVDYNLMVWEPAPDESAMSSLDLTEGIR